MAAWHSGDLGVVDSFFDDYGVVSLSPQTGAVSAIESLFNIPGLTYAREGRKVPPFSPGSRCLACVLICGPAHQVSWRLATPKKRVSELDHFSSEILFEVKLDPKTYERLRGRMDFFQGHHLLLCRRMWCVLYSYCARVWQKRCHCGCPRRSSRLGTCSHTHTASDPETRAGGVGGILYDENGAKVAAFRQHVPRSLMV